MNKISFNSSFTFPIIKSSQKQPQLWEDETLNHKKCLLINPFQENEADEEEFKLWKKVQWDIQYKIWNSPYPPKCIFE